MSVAEAVVRVEGLAARFDGRTVFERVSFEVRRGEVFVILGGSGCGKSTLLKHMIGLYPPAEGRIEVLGEDMAALEGEARRGLLRRIGVMWQSGALFGSLTLEGNVEVPLEEHTGLPAEARALVARAKLGLVGLADAAGRLPAEISGGMANSELPGSGASSSTAIGADSTASIALTRARAEPSPNSSQLNVASMLSGSRRTVTSSLSSCMDTTWPIPPGVSSVCPSFGITAFICRY